MKKLILIFLILLLSSFSYADVGPSPSYSFSISNSAEYVNFDFYYTGNIWSEQLKPITENTSVYKLNTSIKIYAVPKSIDFENSSFELISASSYISEEIQLKSGHTEFKITGFGKTDPSPPLGLYLEEVSNKPDSSSEIFNAIPIIIMVIGALFILGGLFGAIIIVKKLSEK